MPPNNSTVLIDIGQGLSLIAGLPRINSWDTPGRPKNAKRGTFGFNNQTSSLEYYNGTDWFTAAMKQA
jgi:hypothetical protein